MKKRACLILADNFERHEIHLPLLLAKHVEKSSFANNSIPAQIDFLALGPSSAFVRLFSLTHKAITSMSKKIAIYYGTMTGNSEGLANGTFDKIKSAGGEASLHNLADISPEELAANAPNAIFVVSTWGDGEPPTDAEGFFEKLSASSVDLSGLKHAVFGLGDSNYEQFNKFAVVLDERLRALASKSVKEVTKADVDFENTYPSWESEVLELLGA